MKILIIAGHQNIKFNSITSLHGSTGTAGELEINIRIADRVSALLREKGFEVVQSDANANDNPLITKTDFNLALALHCDMDVQGDNGGGMCGSGDKSVDDSWQESLRIKKVFDEVYFKETKIVNKNFVTEGMAKYYIWQYLSPKTPCVLLEMGQAKDPHDSVLLSNTILISTAIVRSVCSALGVVYDNVPSEVEILKDKVKQLETTIEALTTATETQGKSILDLQDDLIAETKLRELCQTDLNTANKKIIALGKQIDIKNEEILAIREVSNKYQRLYKETLANSVEKLSWKELIPLLIKKLKNG